MDQKPQKLIGRSITILLVLSDQGHDDEIVELEAEYPPFTFTAEQTFAEWFEMEWQGHKIAIEHMLGPSQAFGLIFLDNEIFRGIPLCQDVSLRLDGRGAIGKDIRMMLFQG